MLEPTEDWKVEQLLHWWLLRANAESEAEYEALVCRLSTQLEAGKKELWQAHAEVSDILNLPEDNEKKSGINTENENLNNSTRDPSETKPSAAAAKVHPVPKYGETSTNNNQKPDTIHVDIVAGEYQGMTYDLQPRARNHAWVGRSQGKKFREKGISLPKDLEVSTSHGRFEYSRGKFYYMDAASTNGSRIQDMDIEPNKCYELSTGMEITVGQTIMRITLTLSVS